MLKRLIKRWFSRLKRLFKMQGDIRFYIDDKLIDLENDPQLLYNWQLTDFDNPTAYKNSFTKSITLPGTKNNNDILGHFWDLDRVQQYGGNSGVNYNPTYRVPFTIFIGGDGGDIFEKGYVKLEKVKYDKGNYSYDISLYGSIGLFLYNLQTDWNTGEKRTLADLTYYVEDTPLIEPDSNFVIDKETVSEAWDEIDTYSSEWSVLNFAPCLNGKPDKLDANKAVINFNNAIIFQSATTVDGVTYTPSNGYALANLPGDIMENECGDYRSWMQRPVIRVKKIIEAICRPENNRGKFDNGYEVVLDPEWFNTRNPYYEDLWMTTPLISKLDIKTNGESESAYTANYVSAFTGTNYVELVYALNAPVDKFGCTAELNFDLCINVPNSTSAATYDTLYPSGVFSQGNKRQRKFTNAYAVQGFATTGEIANLEAVDGTDVYWLQYNRTDRQTTMPYTFESARNVARLGGDERYAYTPRYSTELSQVVEGWFVRYNNKVYRWNSQIVMSIPLPMGTTSFRIRVDRKGAINNSNLGDMRNCLFKYDYYWPQDGIVRNNTITANNLVSNRTFKIKTGDLSNFYSGMEIKIKDLLKTSFSPADFLLDYCKMMGLYIRKDLYDDKIYIDTRNTFFNRDVVYDLTGRIAYDKEIEIKPTVIDKGYVSFTNKSVEGACYKEYNQKYGKAYGQKILATGYEFDTENKELISSNFKSAVQTRYNSVYCFEPIGDIHPYVFNGLTYNLYAYGLATGDTQEMKVDKKIITDTFPPYNGIPYYDFDDRVEMADAEKKPLAGEYVLLFRQGDVDTSSYGVFVTDDVDAMSRLNGKPCWLLTDEEYDSGGNKIAVKRNFIPHFSRYWTSTNWTSSASSYNNILYSLDFGSPRQLYLINFINYEEATLYNQFFKKYYEDLYDVNTRAVTLWVKPQAILNADSLRNIYWFDNCIWRLNRIIDYSPLANELVKCEFVKLGNLDALTNEIPSKELELVVTLSQYSIGPEGGTITATVHTSDYGPWSVEGWDYDDDIQISPLSGPTDGQFTITVPAWSGQTSRLVSIVVGAGDITTAVSFTQSTSYVEQSINLTANPTIGSADTAINYSVSANPAGFVYLLQGGEVVSSQGVSGNTGGSFAIQANPTASARTFTLSGVTLDGLHSSVVSVEQAAGSGSPVPVVQSISLTATTPISSAATEISYSASADPSGVVYILNGSTLLGSQSITGLENKTYTVGANPTTSARTFTLSGVTLDGLHSDVKQVIQNASSGETSGQTVNIPVYFEYEGGDYVYIALGSAVPFTVNTTIEITYRNGNQELCPNTIPANTKRVVFSEFGGSPVDLSIFDTSDLNYAKITNLDLGNGAPEIQVTYNDTDYYLWWSEADSQNFADYLATLGNDLSGVTWGTPPETPVPYEQQYFTIEALTSGTLSWNGNSASARGLFYSINNGSWEGLGVNRSINLSAGDKVRFVANNSTSPSSFSATSEYIVYGNIDSLVFGDDFYEVKYPTQTRTFAELFRDSTTLIDASNLILPLNRYMTYSKMFKGCTGLVNAPATLPASVAGSEGNSYSGMFSGCTSLVSTPELLTPVLRGWGYQNMFAGCSNLNYVKCLATDISASNSTTNWLSGVSPTGTFVKAANMTSWPSGANGIPSGWTVQDAT